MRQKIRSVGRRSSRYIILFVSLLLSFSLAWGWTTIRPSSCWKSPVVVRRVPASSRWRTITSSRIISGIAAAPTEEEEGEQQPSSKEPKKKNKGGYELGLGKNRPVNYSEEQSGAQNKSKATKNWMAPDPVAKPPTPKRTYEFGAGKNLPKVAKVRTKRIIARDKAFQILKGALWHEGHYSDKAIGGENAAVVEVSDNDSWGNVPKPEVLYPDIDLSIPDTVYSDNVDAVWDLLRYEAQREAQREPLLVSFLHSTILNHNSLESSLAFHLANRLSSPNMISTQIQSLVLEALGNSPDFRRSLRADIMAVRDRDPACTCLPDVFLYFKGFHALQTHRVAHYLYKSGRQVLAHYLQSQMSQNFQIDIHPNATLGSGIMLDHGTGIVMGETATVGHNCSILHHVTLGGSGKKGVDRHPKVGNGVLLGAGSSVLGNVKIGDGCQVGAGTLVISALPAHSVAVGVPAKIIGSFVDVTAQPSIGMNQMTGTTEFDRSLASFESDGI